MRDSIPQETIPFESLIKKRKLKLYGHVKRPTNPSAITLQGCTVNRQKEKWADNFFWMNWEIIHGESDIRTHPRLMEGAGQVLSGGATLRQFMWWKMMMMISLTLIQHKKDKEHNIYKKLFVCKRDSKIALQYYSKWGKFDIETINTNNCKIILYIRTTILNVVVGNSAVVPPVFLQGILNCATACSNLPAD